ncbi:hypothetical protein [Rhizobium sp. CECT 9324]|uniref:hypothetical protein n=1 Tax=Rhizobium sp. CECT 9324 TaxID=2845820 RepID=UPI001E5D64F4|nr:hypothetical protein [Rhizobium sp. CECT 9324]CAH0343739.1 hypothetical protein RHI9324_05476 [Rhizobium sp. CECT 9324]
MAEQKKTFKDTLSALQVSKNNSDLENLARAYEAVDAQIIELEGLRRRIEAAAGDIESGTKMPVEDVRKLYDEAMGRGKRL